MSLISALFGNATQIDPTKLEAEFSVLLVENERITGAFKTIRDLFVFTSRRLILVDKQGLTGKKIEYHSIPYKSISQFSIETAGHFDMDSELRIWISGNTDPLKLEFGGKTDIRAIQQLLAGYVLG